MGKPPILVLILEYPRNHLIPRCSSGINAPFPPLGAPAIVRACDHGSQAFSGEVVAHDLLTHTYTVKITGTLTDYQPNSTKSP